MVTDELGLAPPAMSNVAKAVQAAVAKMDPNSTAPGTPGGEAMRAAAVAKQADAQATAVVAPPSSTAKTVAILGGVFAALTGVYLGFFRGKNAMLAGLADGERYKTFIRTARRFESLAQARKRTVDTNLSYDEASRAAKAFNAERSSRQIKAGTKMEFTRQ